MALPPVLFNWFQRKPKPIEVNQQPSFAPPQNDDGAMVVQASGAGTGTFIDIDGTVRTESEAILRYRQMAIQPEVDTAISEIVNAAISDDEDQSVVEIELDDLKLPPKLVEAVNQEFDTILELLKFKISPHDVFRRWYVDGRLNYHAIINPARPRDGIKEIRPIDSRKIRKIREVRTEQIRGNPGNQQAEVHRVVGEYYLYTDKPSAGQYGQSQSSQVLSGLKISTDAVIYVPSGLVNDSGSMTIGHLHKAIKIVNQLRAIEDAVIIYRLTRAPERRIWFIPTGDLPGPKAEQHIRNVVTKYRNRLTYDSTTGAINSDRRFQTMSDDYFLPVRGDGTSTKVDTLPAGELTDKIADVEMFQQKLYRALNVPISRMKPEDVYALGRASQISQEEVNFNRFIERIRRRFAHGLFSQALGKQLILRGIFSAEDWEQIAPKIRYRWAKDNVFSELKDKEVMRERLDILNMIQPFVGLYYSHETVRKTILMQDDEDIQKNDEEIAQELANPQYNPIDLQGMPELGEQEMPGAAPSPPKSGPPGANRPKKPK